MIPHISPEEGRYLHRQNVLNAQLGIVAAILGIGAAYLGFREAMAEPPTVIVQPAPGTPPAATPGNPFNPTTPTPGTVTGPAHIPVIPASPPDEQGGSAAAPPVTPAPVAPIEKRYLNVGPGDLASSSRVAILTVQGPEGTEQRIADALGGAGIHAHTGVFTSAAFQDGVVDRLSAGNGEVMEELGLTSVNGHLVIARLSFDPVQNTMQDLMMTHASLVVRMVPLRGGHPVSRTFRARGAGFDEAAAVEQAAGRAVQELVEVLSSL